MTWAEIIDKASKDLEIAGISEPSANVDNLAMHVLELERRSQLRSYLERTVNPLDQIKFDLLIDRRKSREPLQYILGEWEFYGLPMLVDRRALIPRPETEILVEEALGEAATMTGELCILDLGTGTGAIALALASRLPHASVTGIDYSLEAIALAQENLDQLGFSNVCFEQADIMAPQWADRFTGKIDLLVSNPPYVSLGDFVGLDPELHYEPREALTDESTGLTFYAQIATIAPKLLTEQGKLLVELGFGHAQSVSEIMQAAGLKVLRIVNDLAGIPRVLVAAM